MKCLDALRERKDIVFVFLSGHMAARILPPPRNGYNIFFASKPIFDLQLLLVITVFVFPLADLRMLTKKYFPP